MDKKLVSAVFMAFLLFTSVSFVNAEVFFSQQPREVYNYGDQLEALIGTDGGDGWVNVDLICSNSSKLVYFHYLTNGETEASLSVPLTKSFLRDLRGNCYLSADFNSIAQNSLDFTIDDNINFDIIFNKNSFEPNETIFFTGNSHKLNGQDVNGFAEVKFTYNALSTLAPISGSSFEGNISLPNNIPSGDYLLEIFAYEKNLEGEVTNFGSYNTSISVSQKPNSLTVSVPETVLPNEDLEFTASLTDQAGLNIDGVPVAFDIINIVGENVHNVLSDTGETNYFKIRSNAPSGYWNLTAVSEGLDSGTYSFYVDINKEASFNLINNTLVVRNIGNVHYDKLVEITIGNHSEVKNLNLSLGKSAEFDLFAPDGNYSVNITDGALDLSGIAALTGDVIGIKGGRRGSLGFFSNNMLAWVFIIFTLGLFIFVSSKKVLNKKMVLSMKNFKFKKKSKGGVVKVTPSDKGDASQELVIHGEKQKASILALKLKNKEEIDNTKSNVHDALKNVRDLITENNGRAYKTGDYIIGIFAPSVTKTFDNSITVVRVGQSISKKLNTHNKKYVHKINFGLSAGEGEIIAKKEKNKLLFTPVGNALSKIKKVADISENSFLLSEDTNKNVASKVKSIANPEKLGIKSYSVGEITEDKDQSKFINKFLERNEYKKLDKFKV